VGIVIPAKEAVVKVGWNDVTPAKAGVQCKLEVRMLVFQPWIPAFAGMTYD